MAPAAAPPPAPQRVLLGSGHPTPPCTAPAPAAAPGGLTSALSLLPFGSCSHSNAFCNWFLVFNFSAKTPAVVLYCRRVAFLWQLQQSACGLTVPPGGRLAHPCAHLPPCRCGPLRILKVDLPGLRYMRRETETESNGGVMTRHSMPHPDVGSNPQVHQMPELAGASRPPGPVPPSSFFFFF